MRRSPDAAAYCLETTIQQLWDAQRHRQQQQQQQPRASVPFIMAWGRAGRVVCVFACTAEFRCVPFHCLQLINSHRGSVLHVGLVRRRYLDSLSGMVRPGRWLCTQVQWNGTKSMYKTDEWSTRLERCDWLTSSTCWRRRPGDFRPTSSTHLIHWGTRHHYKARRN